MAKCWHSLDWLTISLQSIGKIQLKMNMDLATLRKKLQVFFLPHYKAIEEKWIIKKIGQFLNSICSYLLLIKQSYCDNLNKINYWGFSPTECSC